MLRAKLITGLTLCATVFLYSHTFESSALILSRFFFSYSRPPSARNIAILRVVRAALERSVGRPLLLVLGGGGWLELESRRGGAGAGAGAGAGSSNRVPRVISN